MTKWGFQGKHAHIYFIFVWRYSAKLGRKFAVFTCSGGMKTWKPMVVFIETGGFWRCERPSAFNIAKTPSFNETTIGFKFSTPRTRETANIRPSFTETVIQKKMSGFPLKPKKIVKWFLKPGWVSKTMLWFQWNHMKFNFAAVIVKTGKRIDIKLKQISLLKRKFTEGFLCWIM